MKPRFSIFALLIITAYVAVVAAGIRSPASMAVVWLLLLVAALAGLLSDRPQLAAFALGFLGFAAGALVVSLVAVGAIALTTDWRLPESATMYVTITNGQLAAGLFGGFLKMRS